MAVHIKNKRRPKNIQSTRKEGPLWPSNRYDPKTGEGHVFYDEAQVPAGWVEHYSETEPGQRELAAAQPRFQQVAQHGPDLDDEPELPDIDDITVDGIKMELDNRGVEYPSGATKPLLYELLEEHWED